MMKYLIGVLLLSLLFVSPVVAQDSETEAVRRYNITFPIAELGGCTSLSACKTYCSGASHQEACIAFAKKKGFYSEMKADEKRAQLVEDAKNDLGCTSETECRSYCSDEANREKCIAFAKRHGFDGEKKRVEIVERAKSSLGCDSYESCKTYCEQETNRERCGNFARSAGISRSEGQTGEVENRQMQERRQEQMERRQEQMERLQQQRPESGTGSSPTGGTYPGSDQSRPSLEGRPGTTSKGDYCRQYPERCREDGGTNTGTMTYPATGTYPTTNQVAPPSATGGRGETPRVRGISTRLNLWGRLRDFLARFKR